MKSSAKKSKKNAHSSSKKNNKHSESTSAIQHSRAPEDQTINHKEIDNEATWINSLVKQVSSNDKLCSTSKLQRIEKRKIKKFGRMERMEAKNHLRYAQQREFVDSLKKGTNVMGRLERIGYMCKNVSAKYINQQQPPKSSTLLDNLLKSRFQKVKMSDAVIQPRKSSYGGIGLARSTYYLPFSDLSFKAKLEEEFSEHIDGFFGKQRKRAMKKQLDKDMLWKRLLREKKEGPNEKGRKLSPDLKVNAIIDAGASLM